MAAEATKSDSSPKNDSNILSIKQIVNTIIIDDTSPISSWLINVIETYLNNTQKSEPLTIDRLFALTNDMLMTYSISTTQKESKEICSKLIDSLQCNNHLPQFKESFPVNSKCIALYTVDNQWYPAKVLEILKPGQSYLIEFDGYGNQQKVSIDQIAENVQENDEEKKTENESAPLSLADAIKLEAEKDAKLQELIMTDTSMRGNGLKKKNPKYVNSMMKLHEVDEAKLALALSDEDEMRFKAFVDGTKKEKDDKNEMDENDVAKYTVNGRRINPLNDICCICDRMLPLTWHHLIPKCTHNEYMKLHPNVTRLYLNKHGIWICRQCHSAIHGIYTNKELMRSYWKLEMLLESEKVQKWIKYVSKQKVTGHYDRRANKTNRTADLMRKRDPTMKTKYVQ